MPSYSHIGTRHGTTLCVDASGFVIGSESTAADVAHQRLIAIGLDNGADVCFLVAHSDVATPIALGTRDYRSILLPMRMRRVGQDGQVAFLHPTTERYLMAMPDDAPNWAGTVSAESTRVGDWEVFRLRPIEQPPIAPVVEAAAVVLERLLGQTLGPQAVLVYLEHASGPEAAAVLNAVWPLLTLHELEWLAKSLVLSRPLLARLAALLPDDIWATAALPALSSWVATRGSGPAPEAKRALAPALDFLAETGFYGTFVSFPHACNAYARAAIAPARDICIVATARNEGIYLLEWIAYHRALGIDAFFVYSNDNIDGSDDLLSALADAGVITWIDNKVGEHGYAQPRAYAHAFGMLPDVLDYRWALVIDLDEFLVLNPNVFGSIRDFLRFHEMRRTDAVALNWMIVGSGGEGAWRDEPVTRRFRHRFPEPDGHIKTMCRPRQFIHSWPHFPITDDRRPFVWRHSTGDLHVYPKRPADAEHAPAFSEQPNADYAAIYHYFYKSAEEFIWKFSRNRGDAANSPMLANDVLEAHFVVAFVQQHESDQLVTDDRIDRCAPGFESELAKLMELPRLRAAHEEAQRRFRALIDQVKPVFRTSPAILEAGEIGEQFLNVAGISGVGQPSPA